MIIEALTTMQRMHGYLPAGELRALSDRIDVPLYQLHAVASFFPHFRLIPPPAVDVGICVDMSCHLHGATQSPPRLPKRPSVRLVSVRL